MKQLLIFFLSLLFLASCNSRPETTHVIHVAVLRGPSAIAFAQWMEQPPAVGPDTCKIRIVDSPEQMQALLVKREADIAVLPLISAANLYNKGIDYPILGCPVWGTLYVVGRTTVRPPIHLFGRGTTPDILARHALDSLPDDHFNYTFGTAPEVLQALLLKKANTAVLSEPFLSIALRKDTALHILADLNRPETDDAPGFPQTAILCQPSLLSQRAVIDSLLAVGCEFANHHPAQAIQIVEGKGIFAPDVLTEESIRRCRLQYRPIAEITPAVRSFLELIYRYEPQALGENLPDEAFFRPE